MWLLLQDVVLSKMFWFIVFLGVWYLSWSSVSFSR